MRPAEPISARPPGVLAARVWTEAENVTPLRARITYTRDGRITENTTTAATGEEVVRVVRERLELLSPPVRE